MSWLYDEINPSYDPLTYRLGRQGFVYNEIMVNLMEMFIVWAGAFALEFLFILFRIICNPLHYFGDHFADLERSFRY
jgi:hypothetical protein